MVHVATSNVAIVSICYVKKAVVNSICKDLAIQCVRAYSEPYDASMLCEGFSICGVSTNLGENSL